MNEIGKSNSLNPLVSVLCFTYNQEAYVSECIDSIVKQQTSFPFEILIHDDASTDNTLSIIKDYYEKYPNLIRVFTEEVNQFRKVDYIKELKRISYGKYIAFCEGDDYWIDPFKLQRQVDLFRAFPDMTLCFTNRLVLNETTGKIRKVKWKNKKYTIEDFWGGLNPGLQTECLLKDCLTDEKLDWGWDNHINGDRVVPICCSQEGVAYCVPEYTAVYRVTGKGVSTSISANNTAAYWFNHATDDLYHFHESYGFPNCKAYVKSITAYTFNFIRKTGKVFYGISKVSHYGDKSRMGMILKVCFAEIRYLFERACYYTNEIWRKLCRFLSMRFISHQFSIIVLECLEDPFNIQKMHRVKSFKTPFFNYSNKAVTKADAFLYSDGEKMSLFYELQNCFNAKGVLIRISTIDGVNWSKPEVALEESFHLSFPNVFDLDGETWMIPETFMAGQVRLYKEDKATGHFILHSILLKGGKYVDSFIYKKEDTYYLFTSIQYDDQSYDLKLLYSDNLSGEYVEHPMSPLSHGKAYQRNAGRMVEEGGRLYRPAQECTYYYGQNVHIMEIVELSKTTYKEVPSKMDIIPLGKGFGIGGHQYSICDFKGRKYVTIDILHKAFNMHIIWQRFFKKIKMTK